MDLVKIVSELRAELAGMDGAILALERLVMVHTKRRGRPSKWMLQAKASLSAEQPLASAKGPRFRKTLVTRKGDARKGDRRSGDARKSVKRKGGSEA